MDTNITDDEQVDEYWNGNKYELPDDGPGNVVPPRSEVSAQTEGSGSRIQGVPLCGCSQSV